MLIVGEKINTTLGGVEDAIRKQDAEFIANLAKVQAQGGAGYIDVNCATMVGEEKECLPWLVKTVQAAVDLPCCIDSPDAEALDAGLSVHRGQALVNSTTLEHARYSSVVPVALAHKAKLVALVIDDKHGMSKIAQERIAIGHELIEKLHGDGMPYSDIYVDPLIQPIATGPNLGSVALETIAGIRSEFPEAHFMCGLSNISFGLPKRGLLNSTFMSMCIFAGLDGAVMDPTNLTMKKAIYAAEALIGKDAYGIAYLRAAKGGSLE